MEYAMMIRRPWIFSDFFRTMENIDIPTGGGKQYIISVRQEQISTMLLLFTKYNTKKWSQYFWGEI